MTRPTNMIYPVPHNCGDLCQLCDAYEKGHLGMMAECWTQFLEWAKDPDLNGEDQIVQDFLHEVMRRVGLSKEKLQRRVGEWDGLRGEGRVM